MGSDDEQIVLNAIEQKAYEITRELSGYQGPFTKDTSYGTDLGFTDIDKTSLIQEFEDEFDIALKSPSEEDLSSPVATVNYLLSEVKRKHGM